MIGFIFTLILVQTVLQFREVNSIARHLAFSAYPVLHKPHGSTYFLGVKMNVYNFWTVPFGFKCTSYSARVDLPFSQPRQPFPFTRHTNPYVDTHLSWILIEYFGFLKLHIHGVMFSQRSCGL